MPYVIDHYVDNFHRILRLNLQQAQMPLFAELGNPEGGVDRDPSPNKPPTYTYPGIALWNHAIYQYTSAYWAPLSRSVGGHQGLHLDTYHIVTEVVANKDYDVPSLGDASDPDKCERVLTQYALFFHPSGRTLQNAPRQDWMSFVHIDKSGTPKPADSLGYSPKYFAALLPPNVGIVGQNPQITEQNLNDLGLRRHQTPIVDPLMFIQPFVD